MIGIDGVRPDVLAEVATPPSAQRGTPPEPAFVVDVSVTTLTHLGIRIDPSWRLDGKPVGIR